jgi:glycerophosphoryl diester phosphodiesterase
VKEVFLIFIFMIVSLQFHNAQVRIIAHRGASYLAPENTLASAKLAWKNKADAIECDIWLTKDNKIIVSHDGNTKRITGKDHKISETNSDVLRTLDAGSFKDPKYKGEKLPFLYELIRTVPAGKEIVIEIKCGPEVLPFLKETVAKHSKKREFTFICFDLPTITETRKALPQYPCYWLCDRAPFLEKNLARVKEAGLQGVSLNYRLINEDIMKRAAEVKMDLFSWTVNDPDEAKRLITLGVRGITTDRPGWLNEQLSAND